MENLKFDKSENQPSHESVTELFSLVLTKLDEYDKAVSLKPETCEIISGRVINCEGNEQLETIGYLKLKCDVVREIVKEIQVLNMNSEPSSKKQRSTYEVLKWLQAELRIRENELENAKAKLSKDRMEQRLAGSSSTEVAFA